MLCSVITATGSYLPAKRVTNDALPASLDTSDAWIRERTGITARYIAAEGEYTSHMAAAAAQAALKKGGYAPESIDGIVVATSTPDSTMPSVASKLQSMLGIKAAAALDVAAACTGFVAALSVAHGWLMTGVAKRVLVIGAENMSRIVNWTDRSTCVLFGDGAGAVVLEAQEHATRRGILSVTLDAAGEHGDLLGTNGGISSTQTAGHLFMQGQEVFRHGVEKMADATRKALAKAGLTLEQVDWLAGHQANARMLKKIALSLKLPETKCIVTVDAHANTSAASIPLALDTAVSQGKIKTGDIVAMPALGAGLTWGCCVVCW